MPSVAKKHRIYVVDIIRIICALLIFMRHSISMFNCSYGSASVNDVISSLTSPVMSMFFILSGFSINYSNCSSDEWDYHRTTQFYAKRLVQIIPTYLLIHCLWLFFGSDSFARWLVLTPFELSGLQSMYPNIIGVLHNGGTWFISCLLISYLLYPVIRNVLFSLHGRTIVTLTAIVLFLLIYLPAVGSYYQLGAVYSNPVFRCLEFTFGVLICNCSLLLGLQLDSGKNRFFKNIIGAFLSLTLFSFQIYLLAKPKAIGLDIFKFSVAYLIMYPFFIFLLCAAIIMRWEALENNRILRYLSGLIYYFFILQLILWPIAGAVIRYARDFAGLNLSSNIGRISVSFTICLLLSIVLFEFFDKPVKRFCFNKFNIFSK